MRTILIITALVAALGCGCQNKPDTDGSPADYEGLGTVVGKWKTFDILIIHEKSGVPILRTVSPGGGFYEQKLEKTASAALPRYDYKEGMHGEYLIIESNGDLGIYNKDGQKFAEAARVE